MAISDEGSYFVRNRNPCGFLVQNLQKKTFVPNLTKTLFFSSAASSSSRNNTSSMSSIACYSWNNLKNAKVVWWRFLRFPAKGGHGWLFQKVLIWKTRVAEKFLSLISVLCNPKPVLNGMEVSKLYNRFFHLLLKYEGLQLGSCWCQAISLEPAWSCALGKDQEFWKCRILWRNPASISSPFSPRAIYWIWILTTALQDLMWSFSLITLKVSERSKAFVFI